MKEWWKNDERMMKEWWKNDERMMKEWWKNDEICQPWAELNFVNWLEWIIWLRAYSNCNSFESNEVFGTPQWFTADLAVTPNIVGLASENPANFAAPPKIRFGLGDSPRQRIVQYCKHQKTANLLKSKRFENRKETREAAGGKIIAEARPTRARLGRMATRAFHQRTRLFSASQFCVEAAREKLKLSEITYQQIGTIQKLAMFRLLKMSGTPNREVIWNSINFCSNIIAQIYVYLIPRK